MTLFAIFAFVVMTILGIIRLIVRSVAKHTSGYKPTSLKLHWAITAVLFIIVTLTQFT